MNTKIVIKNANFQLMFDAANKIVFGYSTNPITLRQTYNDIEIVINNRLNLDITQQYVVTFTTDALRVVAHGQFKKLTYDVSKTTLLLVPASIIATEIHQKDPIAAYNAAMAIIGKR